MRQMELWNALQLILFIILHVFYENMQKKKTNKSSCSQSLLYKQLEERHTREGREDISERQKPYGMFSGSSCNHTSSSKNWLKSK